MKVIRKILVFIMIFVLSTMSFCYVQLYLVEAKKINIFSKENDNLKKIKQEEYEQKLQNEYNECLTTQMSINELDSELNNKIGELNSYFASINISVVYENLITGFNYSYNPKKIYYGASLVKLAEALYIYEEAAKGNVNLNDTITYTNNDRIGASIGMKKHKVGEKIAIKKLVEYILIYSDNDAHLMLQRHFGQDNIKEYINDLGATILFWDTYGSWSAYDTNKILKRLYEFIEENKILGQELKYWLINDDSSYMINSKIAAHKYGGTKEYFHDIAIVYEQSAYTVSIFTTHGNKEYAEIINSSSTKILELHNIYNENRTKICKKTP